MLVCLNLSFRFIRCINLLEVGRIKLKDILKKVNLLRWCLQKYFVLHEMPQPKVTKRNSTSLKSTGCCGEVLLWLIIWDDYMNSKAKNAKHSVTLTTHTWHSGIWWMEIFWPPMLFDIGCYLKNDWDIPEKLHCKQQATISE